jgi:hypothetical protein
MGAPQLDLVVLPHEFFRGKVVEALQNQQVALREDVEFYLVNLLCEFVVPGKLQTMTGEIDALDTPLAVMLQQALEAPPQERLRIYKYLGDTSLYVSGFFQDYFNRKTFDISYYIALGSSAYEHVATLFRDHHRDHRFNHVFSDLASKFHKLVDVVAEVSEVPGTSKPLDLLTVYDRWTRSNSDRLRKTLLQAGILPVQVPVKDKQ